MLFSRLFPAHHIYSRIFHKERALKPLSYYCILSILSLLFVYSTFKKLYRSLLTLVYIEINVKIRKQRIDLFLFKIIFKKNILIEGKTRDSPCSTYPIWHLVSFLALSVVSYLLSIDKKKKIIFFYFFSTAILLSDIAHT